MAYRHHRFIFGLLLTLALLAQAVVPAGFMPGQSDDGRFELVICTAAGPKVMTVPAAHFDPEAARSAPDEHPDEHHMDGEPSCPYGPVVAQSVPLPAIAVTAAHFEMAGRVTLPPDSFYAAPSAVKPWQSRGPPLS